MKRVNIPILLTTVVFLTFLGGCEPAEHEVAPVGLYMVNVLEETGRYGVGEHQCTVEVSTDCYEYPLGTPLYYIVPEEQLKSMSTLGLVETILENPRFQNYLIYCYQETIDYLSTYVPGLLQELYSRDDAASVLIDRYLGMYYSCTDNNYSTKLGKGVPEGYPNPDGQLFYAFNEIQLLLAQYKVLEKATDEEINSLSIHLITTYLSGVKTDKNYRSWAGATLPWLAARIMKHEEYQPFIAGDHNYVFSMNDYMAEGDPYTYSSDVLDKIILQLNNFIEERLELSY